MNREPPTASELAAALPGSAETLAVLGPVARSSVVDAVADRLRGEILAGRLAAGTRLPSERELSLALGVNRLTLRAALGRVEALGLVAARHTPEQLAGIIAFAEEQKTRVHDPIAYARGEFALERLIIHATGNIALE